MNTATTSLAPANSLGAEWGRFAAFLRRPTLPDRAPMPRGSSLLSVLRMLGLDLVAMIVLLTIASVVMSAGVELPETALAGVEINAMVVLAIVVGAPLFEEIFFRAWLSGRPGHCLAVIAFLSGLSLMGYFAMSRGTPPGAGMWTIAGLVVTLGLVALLPWQLREYDAMRWFQLFFPAFFWLSTLAFSLVHLLNFDPSEIKMALPLVLPQFVTGAILGYLRVNYGLWASMLLHALHNGAFISLVLLASQAA